MLCYLSCQVFFTELSRLLLDSSPRGDGSISNIQDNGIETIPSNESSCGSTQVNAFMNAQMDSLGSVSTSSGASSVFPGASIGSINNCCFQVYHGNVNMYGPNYKGDTEKD